MESTVKLTSEVIKRLENDDFSHVEKVQLFALFAEYLGVCSITEYAKRTGKSYNGVKNHQQIIDIGGLKMVIPKPS